MHQPGPGIQECSSDGMIDLREDRETSLQQVEDDELASWKRNPIEDLIHRIKLKIAYVINSLRLDESEVMFLQTAEGIY